MRFTPAWLSVDDAVSAAIGLLGFGRATQKIAATVEERLEAQIHAGVLERAGTVVILAASAAAVGKISSGAQIR